MERGGLHTPRSPTLKRNLIEPQTGAMGEERVSEQQAHRRRARRRWIVKMLRRGTVSPRALPAVPAPLWRGDSYLPTEGTLSTFFFPPFPKFTVYGPNLKNESAANPPRGHFVFPLHFLYKITNCRTIFPHFWAYPARGGGACKPKPVRPWKGGVAILKQLWMGMLMGIES